ncbi:MAG: immunoglobulin domain-containing protein, partial [Oscillospiraceae bacterium]|nr:immunoglobulin domain-containing protein [Oscillospiraceae bacterium]
LAIPAADKLEDVTPAPAVEPFPYDGDVVNFIKEDGEGFGMFTAQEGTTCVINGDNVVIHYVPKNTTVYGWLHFGGIADAELTKDVTFNADGTFDITLSKDKCGWALPVAPIKVKDGGTSSSQYYLAIPAEDKLEDVTPGVEPFAYDGDEVNFIKEDGTGFGMFAAQGGTTCVINGDDVVIHYVPKNTTVYGWLHFGAITDELTKDVTFNEDGTFDITLPKSNCGTAIPVAPIKKSDETATTSTQYYLAIPAEDKLEDVTPVAEHIDLAITNNTGMFKAVTAYLEIEDGQTTLIVALSGTGYHELFKGTYEQAVVNGDGSAANGNDSWIHGSTNADGKWEFRIPVADGESYIPVVAISNSYYEKYLNGQNSLARAFYPRQMELDREAATLVTGDYEFSLELAVTNNVTMFKVSGAALDTMGGPNSNNYKSTLELTMGSTSFDKAYVGRMSEIGEDTAVIDVSETNVFSLPVKWVATFGQPETLVNLLDEPFIVSFHSANNGNWYERRFTVSEAEGTLVIDKVYADYTAVDAALARVPADLTIYTDESVAALQAAIDAVVRDLTSDKQAQVDAMAQAIEDAIDALVEIAPVVITTQPESFTGSVGETAVFTVAAEGSELTYQWQYKAAGGSTWRNSGMTGADTASLQVPVTEARHGQQYRCVVTDRLGNQAVSDPAALQVTFAPAEIVSQPEDFVGAVGETAVFAVEATGHGLTYQWQYKANGGGTWRDSGMTGNKTASLSVKVTAARSGQMYRCVVTDDAGNQVISDEVWLAVGDGPVIMGQPQSVNCELNTSAVFTVDAAGSGLTYQWQFYTGGSWKNSSLSGNKTATLSVKATAARNGQKYRCVITDADGKTVTTLVVKLTVKLVVTAQPQNVTASAGETAVFTVAATGAGLTYQWQYRTATGTGWKICTMAGSDTDTLSVSAKAYRSGYLYRCVITDANGKTVTSEAAKLTVR